MRGHAPGDSCPPCLSAPWKAREVWAPSRQVPERAAGGWGAAQWKGGRSKETSAGVQGASSRLDAGVQGASSREDAGVQGVSSRLDAGVQGASSREDTGVRRVELQGGHGGTLCQRQGSAGSALWSLGGCGQSSRQHSSTVELDGSGCWPPLSTLCDESQSPAAAIRAARCVDETVLNHFLLLRRVHQVSTLTC